MGERARVLLLGGTGDAAELAARLAGDARIETITSLAGRTRTPRAIAGTVRSGGFGGADGLAAYLSQARVRLVVDATHPYAARMPHNAEAACTRLGIPRLRLLRPEWTSMPGDRWIGVADIGAAAAALPGLARRVLLTTGQRELDAFAPLTDIWFLIRLIEPPAQTPPLTHHAVYLDRGPFPIDDEIALLRAHKIEAVVSKNSGGEATFGKIAAARALNLPVIMIARPKQPAGETVSDIDACLEWIARQPI